MFMNSSFDEEGHLVAANGFYPGCGTDLTGAKELVFYARTENGGERVTFYLGGCGHVEKNATPAEEGEDGGADSGGDDGSPPYPDSTARIYRNFTLTDRWQRYSIDVSDADLSYIQCGFGFVCMGEYCGSSAEIYLDDIYFEGDFA